MGKSSDLDENFNTVLYTVSSRKYNRGQFQAIGSGSKHRYDNHVLQFVHGIQKRSLCCGRADNPVGRGGSDDGKFICLMVFLLVIGIILIKARLIMLGGTGKWVTFSNDTSTTSVGTIDSTGSVTNKWTAIISYTGTEPVEQ